jgi:DNA-binding NarL/FixJ family response regulator
MKKIRVMIADDFEMVRAGLSSILAKQNDVEVIGEVTNGLEAVRFVAEHSPDVVIMDLTMPVMNGVEATRQIVAQSPKVKVIALSIHYDHSIVAEVLKAGASGYLLKDSASDELVTAVRTSQRGETYLSSKVTQVLVSTFVRNPGEGSKPTFSPLSSKQRGVLQLLAEGKSNKEVASCLSISPKTVEAHRAQIMEKLQIHTIAGLTKYAIREGLTSVDV